MPNVSVVNQSGAAVGNLTLQDAVFAIEPNRQALFDAVLVQQSNARQDTSKTKHRDEVSGGGKKPWRQKGTGRARQGSIRSPQWRHGGNVFGPTGEQNHAIKMNKKVRELALKSALSLKLNEKALIVVDQVNLNQPKTKEMVKVLENVKANGKTLFVFTETSVDTAALRSALNIPTVALAYSDQLNVYDLLNCDTLLITKEAVQAVEEVLLNGQK